MTSKRNIFTNKEFKELIENTTQNTKKTIVIYSAFVKCNALAWLEKFINSSLSVKIISRWQPQDLAFGASDLEAYNICKRNNWSFGVDLSLHSKAFIFDSKTVLLGSANLTDRGLSISRDGNLEMGTIIKPTIADLKRLSSLENNVLWLNDQIYNEFKVDLLAINTIKPKIPKWNDFLNARLEPKIEFLWINELLHSPPNSFEWINLNEPNQNHDFELLNLTVDAIKNRTNIQDAFISSRVYRWFKYQLITKNESEYTNFGWLSSKMHNALLDNPPP